MSADFLNGGFLSMEYCFELISNMIVYQIILGCVIAAAIGSLLLETTEAMPSSAIPFLSGNEMTR